MNPPALTSAPTSYLIGVDTGGTYTDAAIIEAQGHRVVASAKSITTKGDLAIGVSGAITEAIAKLPQGLQAKRHRAGVSLHHLGDQRGGRRPRQRCGRGADWF